MRVRLILTPPHLARHYALFVSARTSSDLATCSGDRAIIDGTADLAVVPEFDGCVEVHATHLATGWHTTVARVSAVRGADHITIDLSSLRAGAEAHHVEAHIALPPECSGPCTLTLLPGGRATGLDRVTPFEAVGGEATVWVHGLAFGVHAAIVEANGGAYRVEFPSFFVDGDTVVHLRTPGHGTALVRVHAADIARLEILRRSGETRVAAQRRRDDDTLELSGLEPGEILVQAIGDRVVSPRVAVSVNESYTVSLQLDLGPRCMLRIEDHGSEPIERLRIADARSGAELPLTERETAAFRQAHWLDLCVPSGRYTVTVGRPASEIAGLVEVAPPRAQIDLR